MIIDLEYKLQWATAVYNVDLAFFFFFLNPQWRTDIPPTASSTRRRTEAIFGIRYGPGGPSGLIHLASFPFHLGILTLLLSN